MITRNPCTHPGDIRVLTGVDRPEFAHLTNCVVFSSKGPRPMCNMMAGWDLDGDVYFVCWEKALLGTHLRKDMVVAPQKYEKPTILKEKPEGNEISDFFIWYLERDVLGKIANLHLALCDHYGKDGPKHPDCVLLSHLASVAVDFAKHGECVSRLEYAHIEKIIDVWPDFFEKPKKRIKVSDGILGKLYRSLNYDAAMLEFQKNDYKNAVMLEYELDPAILKMTTDKTKMHSYLLALYQDLVVPMSKAIHQIMITFKFAAEAEIFSSDLHFRAFKTSKSCSVGMGPMKHEDLVESLKNQIFLVRTRFDAVYNEQKSRYGEEEKQNLAVALYIATYFDQNKSSRQYFSQNKKC